MSIKEVIEKLTEFQKEYGDSITVVNFDYEPLFEVIEINTSNNAEDPDKIVIMVS
jgi:CRISPR/Cas system-associated endoribonuclease Cas2